MSEYFRAAATCDMNIAKTSPLPVDTTEVRRQQFMHEKLVGQAVQTQLLLSGLDKFPGIIQAGGKVAPDYVVPGGINLAVDPSERRKGPYSQRKELEQRIVGVEKKAQQRMDNLLEQERVERELQEKRRQVEATKQSRRAAVAEAAVVDETGEVERRKIIENKKEELVLDPLSPGWSRRTAHPVDVLHHRISAEIRRELEEFEHRSARTFLATRLRGQFDADNK